MLNRIARVVVFVAAALAAYDPSAPAAAASADYDHIVNLAGRQRMLTQRMAKEAVLIAMDVDRIDNLRRLQESRDLFTRTLAGLRSGDASLDLPGTADPNTAAKLERAELVWSQMDAVLHAGLIAGGFSDQQLGRVIDLSPVLLATSEEVVSAFVAEARKGPIHTVLIEAINVSGRQRMLSQRMAMQFLLIAHGQEQPGSRQALRETADRFEQALRALINGDNELRLIAAPTVDLQLQLASIDGLWSREVAPLIRSIADGATPTPDMVARVARLNLDLLREMNRAVEMYEML